MNRWRKLLVLLLLCVTMPLQAMAALRTHCAPGTPGMFDMSDMSANSMQSVGTASASVHAAAMMATPHAMTSDDMGVGHDTMAGMHHHGDDGANVAGHVDHDADMSSSVASLFHAQHDQHGSQDAPGSHSHHTSCSACAACVVCTALPQSVAIRVPDAQPSAAIPFFRTSAASAIVAVLERPPKALVA